MDDFDDTYYADKDFFERQYPEIAEKEQIEELFEDDEDFWGRN